MSNPNDSPPPVPPPYVPAVGGFNGSYFGGTGALLPPGMGEPGAFRGPAGGIVWGTTYWGGQPFEVSTDAPTDAPNPNGDRAAERDENGDPIVPHVFDGEVVTDTGNGSAGLKTVLWVAGGAMLLLFWRARRKKRAA